MVGIIGIAALLCVLALSLIVTRVATLSLMFTGLSEEAARFQARSAFTGTGFTTSEAESIVNHPVRRRIIMTLMLLRSAGIITIFISLLLSFLEPHSSGRVWQLAAMVCGVMVLWLISRSKVIDRMIRQVMTWIVGRSAHIEIADYTSLLRLSGPYVIREVPIHKEDWIAGRSLRSCRLRDEGVVVIGIHRADGSYVGVPGGETTAQPGDRAVIYGRAERLDQLDWRQAGAPGDNEHDEAVHDEQQLKAESTSRTVLQNHSPKQ